MSTCIGPDCIRPVTTRHVQLCAAHTKQWARAGRDLDALAPIKHNRGPADGTCTFPGCVRHDDTWPHVCRIYEVTCDHCGQAMAGYARQIMDAAEAHSRQCPGLLRPLEVTRC